MPWRGPEHPGGFPTLGFLVLDWIEAYLPVPFGRTAGDPLVFTREQAEFVLRFYRLDPATGRRAVRRASLVRPRGWGKSPVAAALLLAETLGPVVPDGWDAAGEPVGMPWVATGERADAVVLGPSEEQTRATWLPLLEMLREGRVSSAYAVEPMETFVNLPRGKILYSTSSGGALKGLRLVHATLDQTELWLQANGGRRLAQIVRDNITKVGGSSLETPNAYEPGLESVAELAHRAFQRQREGATADRGILYDHREAPAETVFHDRESMLAGLAVAYGDSADRPCVLHEPPCPSGWVDLGRVLADVWDPAMDRENAHRDFLNQIRQSSDAWMPQPQWEAAVAKKTAADGDLIAIGFDGSITEDATALVACRLEDGHVWPLGVWEADLLDPQWEVPRDEVDAVLAQAMSRFSVTRVYCDPAYWRDTVAAWAQEYGDEVVLEWRTERGTAMTAAVERFHTAVITKQLSHPDDPLLTRHVLNARKRQSRAGVVIAKDRRGSPNKIDAAMAAVLAYEARADAIKKGALKPKRKYRAFGVR